MTLNNCLRMSHDFIKKILDKNSIAVDCTVGNGNDTLFLAKKAKQVYGFDIQEIAISNTKQLIDKNNISNVTLINDGHENIDKYIEANINCAMFNLGYLPKYDHNVSTKYDTTIIAIEKCMKLLSKGGLITIVVYHGQDTGFEEKQKVLEFVSKIDDKLFKVLKLDFINQRNFPPILVVIEKN